VRNDGFLLGQQGDIGRGDGTGRPELTGAGVAVYGATGATPKNLIETLMMKAVRMSAWLLTLAIVILSLVPPELRPRLGGLHALEHFVIFSATGLAFGLGYRQRYSTAIGFVLFAGAIELAQLFVPGRHARLSDFTVDALAARIGLAASQVWRRNNRSAADR
jgi:hypothetical protein